MDIRTPRDIGHQAYAVRKFYRLRQADVARNIGVSRQWIGDLEAGKPTLEIALVLRAFETLGLELTLKRSPEPPPWTVSLTLDAEMRESRTLYGRRRRKYQRRQRAWAIQVGNLAPEPGEKTPEEMTDAEIEEYFREVWKRREAEGTLRTPGTPNGKGKKPYD